MADDNDIGDNPEIEKALEKSGAGLNKKDKKSTPSYQRVGDTKIPVSKAAGKVWRSRKDQAVKKRSSKGIDAAWDEALRYYNNDQLSHRGATSGKASGNRGASRRLNDQWSETENIVFANTSSLVPGLYAKNPKGEFTATDEKDEDLATVVEELVNALGEKKAAPGVNLKIKAKRAVVMAALTNSAYLEVGYTFKAQSNEQALLDVQKLSDELEKAKDVKEIIEVEGKLAALESKIDILQPQGPFVKFRRPHQVIKDPDADELVDCSWMMVYDFIPTAALRAEYGQKDESGKWKSIYQPTHVLNVGVDESDAMNDPEQSFSLVAEDETSLNGYDDTDCFNKAQRTKVWYVWDKTTRRVLMFNDKDWSWPIWVWDDPYNLDTFFPFFELSFYTAPEGGDAKGEVTYYLDQQDAINEINDEMRRARQWARRNILFNKNLISKNDVDAYLAGDKDHAVGVDLPEGVKMQDVVFSMTPPSMQFIQLFDIAPKLQAIDRISSIQDFMRGAQFKTNTTNKAIANYESTAQSRMDEKIDAVEDMLGDVFWAIAQMCLQNMEAPEVAAIIGEQRAALWKKMTYQEIRGSFNVRVVGGSSIKPTGQQKKREALEVGQILGQFSSASPAVIMILMKVFERAFDEVALTDQEWSFLMQSVEQQLQRGNNAPGAGPEGGVPGGEGGNGLIEQVAQVVDQLPPQAKEALGKALAQGVPVKEALARIVQMVQGGAKEGSTQQNANARTQ